jgi:hypothetical protein
MRARDGGVANRSRRRAARRTATAPGTVTARRTAAAPEIRIYPNDPEAPVGLEDVAAPKPVPREPPFRIEGPRYAPAPYAPGTLAFDYWQGEAALERALGVWEDLFERDFTAWHSGRPLRVKLRAGRDLNAFYDRASLQFFYDTDRETGRKVYAAESLEVVTHETGHAILDVFQPAYWSSVDLETAAFHEAFGDCSALVTTLTDPGVRAAFLAAAGTSSRASNLVSRLAEALGRALYDNYGPGVSGDPTCLRDANNALRYAPPETLPASSSRGGALTSEPHSFSRVFTGAFYDLLVWLLALEIRKDRSEAGVERARRLAGRLLARAIETLPPGVARYQAVALAMRSIDQTEQDGVASSGIEASFARHAIKLEPLASGTPPHRALRALDPDRPGGAGALRAALRIPPGASLHRSTLPARTGAGVREQFIHRDFVVVRHRSLGRLSGVAVRVPCGCTLVRGPGGEVERMALLPHPHPSAAELLPHLRRWIALDAIQEKGAGSRSSRALYLERKPFRVTASGVLERAYID